MEEVDDQLEYIKRLTNAPRKEHKDAAKELAEEFCSSLKIFILNNVANIEEESSKYLKRKLKVVGHTMPLILTYQYVNSIQVFEDITGKERPEVTNEYPRFYVPVFGYEDFFGYYVDVEDVWHDPSPFVFSGKELKGSYVLERPLSPNATEQQRLEHFRKEYEKVAGKAKNKKVKANPLALIKMRDLKRVLEYGSWQGGRPRFHWSIFIEAMQDKYDKLFKKWDELASKYDEDPISIKTDLNENS